MAYESSATHLLTGLPHAGLYNYNGKKIVLFHMKWFVDRLKGLGWYLCEMPEVGASIQTFP